mgnify:CR=1 FL=1
MTAVAAGKLGAQIMAGQKLGKFFDIISGTAGKLATKATQAGVGKAADTFYKGVAQENLPMALRSSATSMLPKAAGAAAQLGTYALGTAALDRGLDQVFDQQSAHTQPMPSGVGNKDMANFLYSQQLQNQKFMHDMMLVQARAESRTPGPQYGGLGDRAFEKSLLDEVGVFGRGLYGTGLRA